MSINLISVSQEENIIVEKLSRRYKKDYDHLQYALNLLQECIGTVKPTATFVIAFKAMLDKHIILAALSSMRLHHVQTTLNLRHAAEAGAWTIFAFSNPDDLDKYTETSEDGILKASLSKKAEMYKWLEKEYPNGSASLKKFKDNTNALSTHANIIDASRNFISGEDELGSSFFDNATEFHIRTDLWSVSNLTMGILGLLKVANSKYPQFNLLDGFEEKLKKLSEDNENLAKEIQSSHRVLL